MDRTDIILIGGIIIACIWLMTYILFEDKKKKNIALIVGAVMDIILYFISKNSEILLIGVLGGILFGAVPWLGDTRKYKRALKETGGNKNLAVVMVIFFVMIFMFATIAYPDVKIVLGE